MHESRRFKQVSGKERPTTRWTPDKKAFTIFLPKAGPSSPSTMVGGFSSDFLSCFELEAAQPVPLAARPALPDDSWADIEVDSASGKIETREEKPFASSAAPTASKTVIDIQKEIIVQCSHPPSLKVIEGYLKRWTKRDNNTVNRVSFPSLIYHSPQIWLLD